MKFHQKYYLVEGGPLLALAEEYRQGIIDSVKNVSEFAKSLGATGYRFGITGQLSGLAFSGDVPEGFKKPDKFGVSVPYKKNKEMWEEFKKHRQPKAFEFIDRILDIPTGLGYYKKDVFSGSMAIGHPFDPYGFYWYAVDGPFLMVVPDVEKYASQILEEEPDAEFDEDCHLWRLENHITEGIRPILKEEWDFMRAKYEQEKQE